MTAFGGEAAVGTHAFINRLANVPLYYFHVHYGDEIASDDEGVYRDDLEAARAEALSGIRSILADELRKGRISLAGRVVVMSEDNRIVLTVPFSEAVTIQSE